MEKSWMTEIDSKKSVDASDCGIPSVSRLRQEPSRRKSVSAFHKEVANVTVFMLPRIFASWLLVDKINRQRKLDFVYWSVHTNTSWISFYEPLSNSYIFITVCDKVKSTNFSDIAVMLHHSDGKLWFEWNSFNLWLTRFVQAISSSLNALFVHYCTFAPSRSCERYFTWNNQIHPTWNS